MLIIPILVQSQQDYSHNMMKQSITFFLFENLSNLLIVSLRQIVPFQFFIAHCFEVNHLVFAFIYGTIFELFDSDLNHLLALLILAQLEVRHSHSKAGLRPPWFDFFSILEESDGLIISA